jgi:hypothetical protein
MIDHSPKYSPRRVWASSERRIGKPGDGPRPRPPRIDPSPMERRQRMVWRTEDRLIGLVPGINTD